MKKQLFGKFCLALGCLLGSLGPLQAEVPKEKLVLQLHWLHQFQFAGYYAAQKQGYYAAEGLDVEIRAASQKLGIASDILVSGLADYAVGDAGILLLRMQGKPVVAIAALFQTAPSIWLVRADSGIRNLHDLVGKRLMMLPKTESLELWATLAQEGIDPQKLDIRPMSYRIEDLIEGKVDAFHAYSTNEPYYLQQQGIPWRAISPRQYGIDYYTDVLFTSEEELNQHPERVASFRRASLKGWQYALDHPEEMVQQIHQHYAPEKSLDHLRYEAQAMRELILPDMVELGHMSEKRWQKIGETYQASFNLSGPIDLEGFLYHPEKKDYRWAFTSLAWVGALALLVAGIAAWVGRLNFNLRKEVRARCAAQEELEASKERYLQLFEMAPVPMMLTETQGAVIRQINLKARELFLKDARINPVGRSANEFYGNPEDRLRFAEELKLKGLVKDMQVKVINPSGRVFWTNLSSCPIQFEGKPMMLTGLVDITQRVELTEKLHLQATTDALTGCFNRGHFLEQAKRELQRNLRFGRHLSVLMMDLDHFKHINDRFGHQQGDQAIVAFVQAVNGHLRSMDFMGRLGGEEFGVILPETPSSGADIVAERIRAQVESLSLQSDREEPVPLTVSIGISGLRDNSESLEDLLARADRALYQAKDQGRNRIAYLP
ncbi:MAG: ABC transporter substrate-binding protein [bacterium]|nr:ABC transporter substrate-binding protein [bacterium]